MDDNSKKAVYYLTITPDQSGQRIDNFLLNHLKNIPKSHIYRIIRGGEVRINKKRIKPPYRLQAEDLLRIPPLRMPAEQAPAKADFLFSRLRNAIIYEDNQLLILNKPSGIAVHGGSGLKLGVIETVRQMYDHAKDWELVHRLDRDTSGCLMIAKKRSCLRELHELIRNNQVTKIYTALLKGKITADKQRVDVPLIKNHLESGERIVKVSPEGKSAMTYFSPLQQFTDASLIEVTLITGRTHQIRVHAQYIGCPVAGDQKYGDRAFNQLMRKKGCDRLFLHASKLSFTRADGSKIEVEAPLGQKLSRILEKLADCK